MKSQSHFTLLTMDIFGKLAWSVGSELRLQWCRRCVPDPLLRLEAAGAQRKPLDTGFRRYDGRDFKVS